MTLLTPSKLSNFERLLNLKNKHDLTTTQITILSEYGMDSVTGWFASTGSARHRAVPARAVSLLEAKLQNIDLKEANRELREKLTVAYHGTDQEVPEAPTDTES